MCLCLGTISTKHCMPRFVTVFFSDLYISRCCRRAAFSSGVTISSVFESFLMMAISETFSFLNGINNGLYKNELLIKSLLILERTSRQVVDGVSYVTNDKDTSKYLYDLKQFIIFPPKADVSRYIVNYS